MFSRALKPAAAVAVQNGAKNFSTSSQRNFKVVVAGASGGIGQPLALLLKQNPLVSHLACYDIAPVTPGVAVDLSHMDTPAKVTGHKGPESLADAIKGADLVVIPAGVPRKPGMTRDDLFNTNASIVRDLAQNVAKHSPKAIMAIITNPVNSMVPIASEVMKKANVYDEKRILGVTTLDVVRAAAFIGEINGVDPRGVTIPVIGGHSGVTIIPVLSQSNPAVKLSDQGKIEALTQRIQEAGTEVSSSGVTITRGSGVSQSNPAVKLSDQGKIEALTQRIQEAGTEVSSSGVTISRGSGVSQSNPAVKLSDQGKVEALTQRIQEAGTEVSSSGVTITRGSRVSQSNPAVKLSDQGKIEALTQRIQEAGTEVSSSGVTITRRSGVTITRGSGVSQSNPAVKLSDQGKIEALTQRIQEAGTEPGVGGQPEQPAVKLNDQGKIEALTQRIQEAGTEVVKAKAGGGSATLSMAYAGARLAGSVLRGLKGESNVVECAYIKSDITESPYFANPVVLGKNGVEKNLGYGKLNAYEQQLLKAAIPELLKNIKVGVDFVNKA
ncbi:lactate/malate dehydrogenase, NAD binding domain-containing protein [Phthorimaea operculella]|nr:lactate/malate dehydrogenase, NAD binding domain-containing protein [Phthorimaea operculella]